MIFDEVLMHDVITIRVRIGHEFVVSPSFKPHNTVHMCKMKYIYIFIYLCLYIYIHISLQTMQVQPVPQHCDVVFPHLLLMI